MFDVDTRLIHHTSGYGRLSLSQAEDQELRSAARTLARALTVLAPNGETSASAPRPIARTLRLGRRVFRLDGSRIEPTKGDGGPILMVTIEEARGSRPNPLGFAPPLDLQDRFGLTPREAEVATLLAHRLSNREVARHLGISPHTARHHTQRVLLKLGVRSRRRVRARVFGPERGSV